MLVKTGHPQISRFLGSGLDFWCRTQIFGLGPRFWGSGQGFWGSGPDFWSRAQIFGFGRRILRKSCAQRKKSIPPSVIRLQTAHTRNRPEPDPNQTRTRPEPDPNQAQTRPEPHPNQTRTRSEPEPNQTRTRLEPDPNQTRTRPEPDPNQTRTRTEPDPSHTRTTPEAHPKPHPNHTRTRSEPDPNQTRTRPEPNPNQTRTRLDFDISKRCRSHSIVLLCKSPFVLEASRSAERRILAESHSDTLHAILSCIMHSFHAFAFELHPLYLFAPFRCRIVQDFRIVCHIIGVVVA